MQFSVLWFPNNNKAGEKSGRKKSSLLHIAIIIKRSPKLDVGRETSVIESSKLQVVGRSVTSQVGLEQCTVGLREIGKQGGERT